MNTDYTAQIAHLQFAVETLEGQVSDNEAKIEELHEDLNDLQYKNRKLRSTLSNVLEQVKLALDDPENLEFLLDSLSETVGDLLD